MSEQTYPMLRPRGRLDGSSSILLEQDCRGRIDAGDSDLVIDLSQIEFISSAGLRTLATIARDLKSRGGRLVLCALRAPVKEVFDVTGYTALIDVFPNYQAAAAHLAMR